MKILIINTYYYPNVAGGGEFSIKKLAENLVLRGNKVFVLCESSTNEEEISTINGVVVYREVFIENKKRDSKLAKIKRVFLQFKNKSTSIILPRLIKTIEPDVVYTNMLRDLSLITWRLCKQEKIPLIDTQRAYSLINLTSFRPSWLLNKAWQVYGKKQSKYVDAEVSISSFSSSFFTSQGFFSKANHSVIFNSIDYSAEKLKALIQYRLSTIDKKEEISFVFLGNLSKEKGITELLSSFSATTDANIKLFIAGKGELEQLVTEYANKDKRITFVGWLAEEKVNDLLQKCDVLICPSIWNEPFGRIVLDAYKNGLPVIASNRGGLPEIVVPNKTGLVIEPKNDEIISAIHKFSSDKSFLSYCIQNIPSYIENFSLDQYTDSFEKIFRQQIHNT